KKYCHAEFISASIESCHAELVSASVLDIVHRFRNEFGMTLCNEFFGQLLEQAVKLVTLRPIVASGACFSSFCFLAKARIFCRQKNTKTCDSTPDWRGRFGGSALGGEWR
ncbi:MAG TPA: hypothetical protein DEO40_00465, partial [Treponema sp.]|nr:hypothetical protein [Treponema sp.]